MTAATSWKAPAGPTWVPAACEDYTVQTDGRGDRWVVTGVLEGGRRLTWRCLKDGRVATTIATAAHPDYPSDATVLAAARQEKKDHHARLRRWAGLP